MDKKMGEMVKTIDDKLTNNRIKLLLLSKLNAGLSVVKMNQGCKLEEKVKTLTGEFEEKVKDLNSKLEENNKLSLDPYTNFANYLNEILGNELANGFLRKVETIINQEINSSEDDALLPGYMKTTIQKFVGLDVTGNSAKSGSGMIIGGGGKRKHTQLSKKNINKTKRLTKNKLKTKLRRKGRTNKKYKQKIMLGGTNQCSLIVVAVLSMLLGLFYVIRDVALNPGHGRTPRTDIANILDIFIIIVYIFWGIAILRCIPTPDCANPTPQNRRVAVPQNSQPAVARTAVSMGDVIVEADAIVLTNQIALVVGDNDGTADLNAIPVTDGAGLTDEDVRACFTIVLAILDE